MYASIYVRTLCFFMKKKLEVDLVKVKLVGRKCNFLYGTMGYL